MESRRKALRVIAAAAATVAVAVAVNQVLNGGRWNLWALVAAIALAIVSEALDLWLGTQDKNSNSDDKPALWHNLTGEDGRPLRLREVTPRDLGVHPSRFGAEGDSPYVHRQADDLLADALKNEDKRLVIVEGPRLAGATSTLAQAAQVRLPDYLAAGFVDDPRVRLADMITQAGRWTTDTDGDAPGVALWLDSLGPDRFVELARVPLDDLPPGVRVLATLDTGELEGLRIPEQLDKLLSQHAIRIRLTTITEQERHDLRTQDAYAALRPMLDQKEDLFLGRVMVAWEPVREALTRGTSEQALDRVALLRAITDWYRVHLPRLLNLDVAQYLYRAYRAELTGADPGTPISATGFGDALQWTMAAPAPDRPRLIDVQDVSGGQRYAPHPLLAAIADDPNEDAGWPVADALWSYADRYLGGDQRRDIGYSALARGAHQAAARLLSHADTTVNPGAYIRIASLFHDHDEWTASRDWLRRAVNTDDSDQAPKAMNNLGILEAEQNNLDQARHWFQQAIDTGHPDTAPNAMVNLGILNAEQNNLDQARHWFQQAIDTDHPHAAPNAMVNLGILECDHGDLDRARHWYQQAIGTGHSEQAPKAMYDLGILERDHGDLDRARHWFQEAIGTGHSQQAPRAMFDLGILERNHGDLDQARHWFQQAIDTGHSDAAANAMVHLGILECDHGDLDRARHWYQQAIDTANPDAAPKAMNNLGNLEYDRRDLDQARHWYQEAIDTGHSEAAPTAMLNLGNVERDRRDLDQARHWYQRAIDTGHSEAAAWAMVNLGILERNHGDLDQARHWLQQAIGTGYPEIDAMAQQALRALDRGEDERLRGERFGRYGYLVYANPDLMNRDKAHLEISAAGITDPASEPDHDDKPLS
jgi:TPR repeat protein